VLDLRRHQRLAPFVDTRPAYRYEREVEEFLRRSPSARPAALPVLGAIDRLLASER
jgi:hypothetical protein